MDSFKKLTQLQTEVGYKKGNINNIALLGLFGEAGEVLNECEIKVDGSYPILEVSFEKAIKTAESVDGLKKKIRDMHMPPFKINIKNEQTFDAEMADVLYYLNALAINRGKTLADYAEIVCAKVTKFKTQKNIRHASVSHAAIKK